MLIPSAPVVKSSMTTTAAFAAYSAIPPTKHDILAMFIEFFLLFVQLTGPFMQDVRGRVKRFFFFFLLFRHARRSPVLQHGVRAFCGPGTGDPANGCSCIHLCFYVQRPRWGLIHLRLQTWFPFRIQICLNGHEWLARQMDRLGMAFRPLDNRFTQIDDLERAQVLMDEQLTTHWTSLCEELRRSVADLHRRAELSRTANERYLAARVAKTRR